MGTAGCVCELSRNKLLDSLFLCNFQTWKARKLKTLRRQMTQKSLKATANNLNLPNPYKPTQPTLMNSLCPVSESESVKCSHGLEEVLIGAVAQRVEKCLHINHPRTPLGAVFSSILLSLLSPESPHPSLFQSVTSSSPSTGNGLPL